MNREIKFRGQRTDNKEWVYGFLTKCQNRIWENGQSSQDGYKIQIISHEMPIGVWDVIPETVGQYAGLNDKNGVEIYEGDILQRINGEVRTNNAWGPNREISIVVWEDAAFSLKSPGSEAVDWAYSSYYQCTEVIGNIHENPELLKTKS